ncbi:hypothetical protein AHAS_Ahas19G0230600 [Arachis hypogaea]
MLTLASESLADLLQDRPSILGNPRNIGTVAGEPGNHPIIMANNLDNNHNSDNSHKDQDPFTKEILKAKVPEDFKSFDITLHNGTSDPSHHLSNFRSRMYLTDASDAIRCKAFPTTLTKAAIKWFDSLPPRLIANFDDLAKKFLDRFSTQMPFSSQSSGGGSSAFILGFRSRTVLGFRSRSTLTTTTCT